MPGGIPAPHIFEPAVDPPAEHTEPAWWFLFRRGKLLVTETEPPLLPQALELSDIGLPRTLGQYLGRLDGTGAFCAEIDDEVVPPAGYAFQPLRGLYGRLDDALFALAGRAVQIVAWDRTHRFCGQCGARTGQMEGERAKKCPLCGLVNYPRIAPAVIVLVTRGDEVLLARANNFPTAFYSTLAGFVEPGETLEEAVRREVGEEVGITLDNIKYFGSQPWPYPHSLMIGFTADYAGGDIQVDGRELSDAAWFTRDNMPQIPPKLSIARSLIESYLTRGEP